MLPPSHLNIQDSIKRLIDIIVEIGTIGNLPKIELAYAKA